MFDELAKGVVLRDLIAEILRDGQKSISQVGKALRERGLKLHRLAVAGYLRALADQGFLVEHEIPPAKTYALRPTAAKRDLHRTVAEQARAHATPNASAERIYLQVLGDLFHRPIFREEFVRVGMVPPAGADDVAGEDRQNARRVLSKSTVKLPFNDAAYRNRYADASDEAVLRDLSRAVLAAIVRDEFHAHALAMTTKQVTLGGTE